MFYRLVASLTFVLILYFDWLVGPHKGHFLNEYLVNIADLR